MSRWARDTTERALFTFVQAFTATWVVGGGMSSARSAAIAGVAAVLAVIKAAAASRVAGTVSPASVAADE